MNVSIKGLSIKALINIYLILLGHCVFRQLPTILWTELNCCQEEYMQRK